MSSPFIERRDIRVRKTQILPEKILCMSAVEIERMPARRYKLQSLQGDHGCDAFDITLYHERDRFNVKHIDKGGSTMSLYSGYVEFFHGIASAAAARVRAVSSDDVVQHSSHQRPGLLETRGSDFGHCPCPAGYRLFHLYVFRLIRRIAIWQDIDLGYGTFLFDRSQFWPLMMIFDTLPMAFLAGFFLLLEWIGLALPGLAGTDHRHHVCCRHCGMVFRRRRCRRVVVAILVRP